MYQSQGKYKDKRWEQKRQSVLRRDGYKCRECARFGRVRAADTVHHVKPAEDYPELFWVSNNLISLCTSCHNKMHVRNTRTLTELGQDWIVRLARRLRDEV
jgi:5-methylcytosine-specific restriction enzyme A